MRALAWPVERTVSVITCPARESINTSTPIETTSSTSEKAGRSAETTVSLWAYGFMGVVTNPYCTGSGFQKTLERVPFSRNRCRTIPCGLA